MNQPDPSERDALARHSGQSSARHAGLRHPADDASIDDKLASASLDSLGAGVEDAMRDRRSKGLPDDDAGDTGLDAGDEDAGTRSA